MKVTSRNLPVHSWKPLRPNISHMVQIMYIIYEKYMYINPPADIKIQ